MGRGGEGSFHRDGCWMKRKGEWLPEARQWGEVGTQWLPALPWQRWGWDCASRKVQLSPPPSAPSILSTSCPFGAQPKIRVKTRLCLKEICSRRTETCLLSLCPATLVSLREFSALGLFAFLGARSFWVSAECGFCRFPECSVQPVSSANCQEL